MQEFYSTIQVAEAVGMSHATLSRLAVSIDLAAGSKNKMGSNRRLDFNTALALVLLARCRRLSDWRSDDRCLFESILEKLQEFGEEAAEYSIIIYHDSENMTIGKRDVKNVYHYRPATFFTSLGRTSHTILAIRPLYEKLDHLMRGGPVPQLDAPEEGLLGWDTLVLATFDNPKEALKKIAENVKKLSAVK